MTGRASLRAARDPDPPFVVTLFCIRCRAAIEPGGTSTPAASLEAEIGWLPVREKLYVNVDDLIALLRSGDYTDLAEDFERIAAEERRA